MDDWGWQELEPWLTARVALPVGPLSASSTDAPAAARGRQAGHAPSFDGPQREPAFPDASPHQLRHAHAVEMAREGVPLIVIQRQLGHSNLGITSVYLQGIDNAEIIETVHARRAPIIPVSAWPRS